MEEDRAVRESHLMERAKRRVAKTPEEAWSAYARQCARLEGEISRRWLSSESYMPYLGRR